MGTPPSTSICSRHGFERVLVEVRHPRGSRSLSPPRSRSGLDESKAGILYEHLGKDDMNDPGLGPRSSTHHRGGRRPIDEAISTAGGRGV